jgi:hypothetical protein
MGVSYSSEPTHLKKAKLTKPLLAAIGKLVRAMADFVDMVDLHICNLASLSESQSIVLLGRTAVTRRLEIAEALAAMRTDGALDLHRRVFGSVYNDLVPCRNAVAHGALIGKSEAGRLHFLSTPQRQFRPEQACRTVVSYLPSEIIGNAEVAEKAVPHFEQLLQVEELRAERLRKPLEPHAKGLKQRSAKPQRPPQSSEAKPR